MKRTAALLAVAGAASGLAAAAYAARPTLHVAPQVVRAGGIVHISGRARGCPRPDVVTVISRAFTHRQTFAGVGAVMLRLRAHSLFSGTARIRRRARGTYRVSARCGGGNLGVTARLRVTAP